MSGSHDMRRLSFWMAIPFSKTNGAISSLYGKECGVKSEGDTPTTISSFAGCKPEFIRNRKDGFLI
jgi:hypothetical protein